MLTTQDPLNIEYGIYKLAFENDRVRVLDINITPGGKTSMHSHPGYEASRKKPISLYQISSGNPPKDNFHNTFY
jgi:hypothetical protein